MNPSEEHVEQGTCQRKLKRLSSKTVLTLAYQSLGVVYGDLSTSPLYVYKTTFSGKLSLHEDDEEIFGVFSFIFWTFTLIALFKYVFVVMSADDNGVGGTFALYSLLCRHARASVLPNQEAVDDEKLSTYMTEECADTWPSLALKQIFEKHPKFCEALLIFVLLGTSMVIGDGVLTPAVSDYVVVISCAILAALFSLQHHGTHRVAFMFAPIVTAWLFCIACIGTYNIFHWTRRIFRALLPVYMFKFLRATGVEGWVSLGGVVLSMTGVEAMFASLGHFSPLSIKIAFTTLVHPSLILAYMGEAAFLSKHHDDIQRSFYKAIPEPVFWPVFIVATFAAVVGSQAAISATFSLVSQCCALNCFPRVKVVHTSSEIYGQIYIPQINWILMCLCLAVTIGLRDTNMIGLAVTIVMFVTTCPMALVMTLVWKKSPIHSFTFPTLFRLHRASLPVGLHQQDPRRRVRPSRAVPNLHGDHVRVALRHAEEAPVQSRKRGVDGPDRVPRAGPGHGPGPGGRAGLRGPHQRRPRRVRTLRDQPPRLPPSPGLRLPQVRPRPPRPRGREARDRQGGPEGARDVPVRLRYGYKDIRRDNHEFESRLVEELVRLVESKEELGSDPGKTETVSILRAKESGVAYILRHCYAKSKKSSSVLKRIAIDIVYTLLSKNCRGPDVALNVPHTFMLEVGMVYYV